MELTLRIDDSQRFAFLIEMLSDLHYVEIVNVKENSNELTDMHKKLLEERIEKIKKGQTTFKSWEEIKKKYEVEV